MLVHDHHTENKWQLKCLAELAVCSSIKAGNLADSHIPNLISAMVHYHIATEFCASLSCLLRKK